MHFPEWEIWIHILLVQLAGSPKKWVTDDFSFSLFFCWGPPSTIEMWPPETSLALEESLQNQRVVCKSLLMLHKPSCLRGKGQQGLVWQNEDPEDGETHSHPETVWDGEVEGAIWPKSERPGACYSGPEHEDQESRGQSGKTVGGDFQTVQGSGGVLSGVGAGGFLSCVAAGSDHSAADGDGQLSKEKGHRVGEGSVVFVQTTPQPEGENQTSVEGVWEKSENGFIVETISTCSQKKRRYREKFNSGCPPVSTVNLNWVT